MTRASGTLLSSAIDDADRNDYASSSFDPSASFQNWLSTIRTDSPPSESAPREIIETPSTVVNDGMVMNCEISFHGMLRVDGHLTGRVESDDGVLIVSSTGTVDAGIKVAVAVVDGIVRGDIYASERIEIGSGAQVIGDIETPSLSLAEGGILDGNCHFMMPGIVASPSATEVSRPQLARDSRDSEAKKNSTGSDSDKPTVLAAMVGHC